MGLVASAAERHGQAALLFEEALSLHRAISDNFGQALDLRAQAEAFWALEAHIGALAAWWQAREIFQDMHSPAVARLDSLFSGLEKQMGPEAYSAMIADLQAHAEEPRREEMAKLNEAAKDDPFLQEIRKLLLVLADS